MTIAQIACFVEAAGTGSFSKAGMHLFVSQQTVSRQIKSLENELGFKLFERRNTGVVLTEQGRQFYEVESELLRQHQTLIDRLRDSTHPDNQRLRIGLSGFSSYDEQRLAGNIMAFSTENPELEVEYRVLPVNTSLDWMDERELDLLITFQSELEKSKDLYIRPIPYGKTAIGLVISQNHPYASRRKLTFKDLEDEVWGVLSPAVSLDHKPRLQYRLEHVEGLNNIRIKEYTSKSNLQIALVNGKCVTFVYEDIMNGMEDSLKFYPQPGDRELAQICMAWKSEEYTTKARNLADFLQQHLASRDQEES
jgi:DNA-binding transcriptional LysR family regulator